MNSSGFFDGIAILDVEKGYSYIPTLMARASCAKRRRNLKAEKKGYFAKTPHRKLSNRGHDHEKYIKYKGHYNEKGLEIEID